MKCITACLIVQAMLVTRWTLHLHLDGSQRSAMSHHVGIRYYIKAHLLVHKIPPTDKKLWEKVQNNWCVLLFFSYDIFQGFPSSQHIFASANVKLCFVLHIPLFREDFSTTKINRKVYLLNSQYPT